MSKMDLEKKTYDSPEEIVVQAHRWITKNQRMLVCVDGYSLIVDRSVIRSYDVMLSTCVYVAETPGRFSKKDEHQSVDAQRWKTVRRLGLCRQVY